MDLADIRAERKRLTAALRHDPVGDPRILKVLALIELEELYEKDKAQPASQRSTAPVAIEPETATEPAKPWPSAGAIHSRGTGKVHRRMDPNRLRVLEQAANIIRGRPYPTKTVEIYEAMAPEDRALIRGAEPKGNLSAMLYHSPLYVSHGRAGWTLADDAPPAAVDTQEDRQATMEELLG